MKTGSADVSRLLQGVQDPWSLERHSPIDRRIDRSCCCPVLEAENSRFVDEKPAVARNAWREGLARNRPNGGISRSPRNEPIAALRPRRERVVKHCARDQVGHVAVSPVARPVL